jgi:hypothetical protein
MITGTYDLVVDPQWRNLQLQEVFLECDTTLAPVTINLFEIADLNRFWNVKVIISDVNNNAATNNITINAGGSDIIDSDTNNQIVLNSDGESLAIQVASEQQWLALESVAAGGGALPTAKGSLMNISASTPFSSPIARVFTFGEGLYDPILTHTGTLLETILTTQIVPANTYKIGDFTSQPLFSFLFVLAQNVGGGVVKAYSNVTPDLSGTPLLLKSSTFAGAGTTSSSIQLNAAPSGSQQGMFIGSNLFRSLPTIFPLTYLDTTTFDITTNCYFILTVTLNNVADEFGVWGGFTFNTLIQSV